MTTAGALEARAIACERASITVFENLSFRLARGEMLCVTGMNGSGKSTLLRAAAGLLKPVCGSILWCGEAVAALGARLRSELLYIGHAAGLKDNLSAAENLIALMALGGRRITHRDAQAAMGALGIPDLADRDVRRLSQGQRRRVGLARLALGGAPGLWILDEPFAALDRSASECLEALLERHLRAGGVVLLSTHQRLNLEGRELHLQGAP